MAEIASNMYDLIYPSPVALKELASMAVSAHLWRFEINKYRENGTLTDDVSLKETIPGLPSVIHDDITKYIKVFGDSMFTWLDIHFKKIFRFHRDNEKQILNDFNDFVCDWDGSINYDRTAKRMMICNRLSDEEKFKIACLYCFEDDIKRVWPSVSGTIDVNDYFFNEYPQLCYWIYLMRNESHLIPNERRETIDEMMLFKFQNRRSDWSSILYFWDRVTPEYQCQQVGKVYSLCVELFIRFILPKLSEQLLSEFLLEKSEGISCDLVFEFDTFKRHFRFPTWMYIKDKIPAFEFSFTIRMMLAQERTSCRLRDDDETNFYCDLWRSAPHNLKQSVLKMLLPCTNMNLCYLKNKPLSSYKRIDFNFPSRSAKLLLTMLSDATFDERSEYWSKNWTMLIEWSRIEDFNQIMQLCLKNEEQITQFKEMNLCKFENIREYCMQLLEGAYFNELDDFLNFCCSNIETRRIWKQDLLQVCFLGEPSILNDAHLQKTKWFEEFISNAYETSDQAADFRNKVISSPETEFRICMGSIRLYSFSSIMHFVSRFEPTDEILSRMKNSFADFFKGSLEGGFIDSFNSEMAQKFLLWCLESEDQVTKFKQSMSAKKIVNNVARYLAECVNPAPNGLLPYPRDLDEFLKWFFNSSEEIQKFKHRFAYIFRQFGSNSNP